MLSANYTRKEFSSSDEQVQRQARPHWYDLGKGAARVCEASGLLVATLGLIFVALRLALQEKVVNFVLRHEEGSEHISKTALLQFLQHEYEVC